VVHVAATGAKLIERTPLQALLASQVEHLPDSGEAHFHIVVSTDNEFEFEFARFLRSPPYRDLGLAELDAKDPRLVRKANGFDVDILECHRACPRSHRDGRAITASASCTEGLCGRA